ncbi:ferritin-like domain-containing protein [Diaminobutyricibacter tongyongensis]|uniref:Ferritin-like domain-containing protein n=1 Tax=Leifsonia tongyongensis TaxID=1268043 RepID=A0A6L9Y260_9MICO|nr:ferritin-like domain-containing protein [Diaminobutyricibacter tongyongensis]NEN07779.1 ferritin-like domain-containing protein [Diaminobutyricibacter tongyongensis]
MSDNNFLGNAVNRSAETKADRDGLNAMVAAAEQGNDVAEAPEISDSTILNFALNLEYLEAEFYLRAGGQTLPDDMTTGTGTRGEVIGGRPVMFQNPVIRKFAAEIAADERAHVAFLRNALGSAAVSRPAISLDQSFTAAALAAGLIKPGETFDAYANDLNFLFAAFLFEDVGVTAFKGAAPFISNKTYLDAAAGLLATEAYHAGIVRTSLYNEGMINDAVFDAVQKISNVRGAVDGVGGDDQGIGTKAELNLVPTDPEGRAFGRSPEHILNIVYLTADRASSGGFYPNGLNGDLRESAQAH